MFRKKSMLELCLEEAPEYQEPPFPECPECGTPMVEDGASDIVERVYYYCEDEEGCGYETEAVEV